MMILPQRPTYYDQDEPEKRLDAIGTYLDNLREELEKVLSDVQYDNLNYSIKKKFEDLSTTIGQVSYLTNQVRADLNTNFTRTNDIVANGITVGSHTYTEKTATIDGQTIHYLGYEE